MGSAVAALLRRGWLQALAPLSFALASGCSGCDCFGSSRGCGGGSGEGCNFDLDLGDWTGAGGFGSSGSMGGFSAATGAPCTPCGADCCVASETCWEEQCLAVAACATSNDCPDGEVCDFEPEGSVLSTMNGAGGGSAGSCSPRAHGLCVPARPGCEESADLDCLAACALAPSTEPEALVPAGAWGMAPDDGVSGAIAVLPLWDDNCDGRIDEHDGGDVLALTATGSLRAFALEDGALVERWTTDPGTPPNDPDSAVAAARLSTGDALVVVCTEDDRVRAYDETGAERWLGPPSSRCASLAIGQLLGSALPEVVSESQVLDSFDGAEIAAYGPAPAFGIALADVRSNGGGKLEIVTASLAYDGFGTPLVASGLGGELVAVGDLDGGGLEILAVDPVQAQLRVWRDELGPVVLRAGIDLHASLPLACPVGSPGSLRSGGPPALADVDGDGTLDVAVAHARGVSVYSGAALADGATADSETLLWASPIPDCDGGTRGSTAFDFAGGGQAAVLSTTGAELVLHDAGGTLLQSLCHPSVPGVAYPIVADLDGDGAGEVLAPASGAMPSSCPVAGLARYQPVFGLARTRAVHNALDYRVANVRPDGRLPTDPYAAARAPRFRANPSSLDAPDLTIAWRRDCAATQRAVVRNEGRATLRPGEARVSFHDATSMELVGEVVLGVPLAPGTAIDVELAEPATAPLVAQVLAAEGQVLRECVSNNNATASSCP